MSADDLTTAEQGHVRAALQFLRARCGGWAPLAQVLRAKPTALARVGNGRRGTTASLAVRIARLACVGVDDVLGGRFPPAGACPHCGRMKVDAPGAVAR